MKEQNTLKIASICLIIFIVGLSSASIAFAVQGPSPTTTAPKAVMATAAAYDPNAPYIDSGLADLISSKIDSDVDGTQFYRNSWQISRSEYKAWIALIAMEESGQFG